MSYPIFGSCHSSPGFQKWQKPWRSTSFLWQSRKWTHLLYFSISDWCHQHPVLLKKINHNIPQEGLAKTAKNNNGFYLYSTSFSRYSEPKCISSLSFLYHLIKLEWHSNLDIMYTLIYGNKKKLQNKRYKSPSYIFKES
jgi:hypothetical protein